MSRRQYWLVGGDGTDESLAKLPLYVWPLAIVLAAVVLSIALLAWPR